MICPMCHGKGVENKRSRELPKLYNSMASISVCRECGGCGIVHCCEGDQVTPSKNEEHMTND
jgi:DnaJ-class molecular chaperone